MFLSGLCEIDIQAKKWYTNLDPDAADAQKWSPCLFMRITKSFAIICHRKYRCLLTRVVHNKRARLALCNMKTHSHIRLSDFLRICRNFKQDIRDKHEKGIWTYTQIQDKNFLKWREIFIKMRNIWL